jgi:hypothetical protein
MFVLLLASLLVVIVVLAAIFAMHMRRETFTAQEINTVYERSKNVFDSTGGNATYSHFKTQVPGADPVLHSDTRKLWQNKELTPNNVAKVM